jgi:hypothetical protein
MDMSGSQTNPPKHEVIPVSADHPESLTGQGKVKHILKWVLTCLPLGGIAWASFLPLQPWMQQALILVALIWFYVFFLLDTFFLGG